ncbi:Ubiquitin carboxyl-terminal hydrolase family protein [Reticulomyxa filosa]|uniref:Ubiquitin carboxyl-terminal hydrolase family protein n=1 Tax=Reticulomyxa filosa TaxID=46433 RepID=X6PFQ3_RETFI|nr:Ubiquitin carboxyl-terminal hydrolase family protein [Reticulomyxa filosa]|eukprot:ETO37056.1 Ubiquitin carboxyl-terminal hydrolase family protein [Reticulomyxa filosa]
MKDIPCFAVVEKLFGFLPNDRKRPEHFYNFCGLPGSDMKWHPETYGVGEMAMLHTKNKGIERIDPSGWWSQLNGNTKDKHKTNDTASSPRGEVPTVESPKKDTQALLSKQEWPTDTTGTDKLTGDSALIATITTPNNEETQQGPVLSQGTSEKSSDVKEMEKELELLKSQLTTLWEFEDETAYLEDFTFAGKNPASQSLSWFRLHNINYFGHIGGFDIILERISRSHCPISFNELVNILRPAAQLRDLINTKYFDEYISKAKVALVSYFNDLPDDIVKGLNRNVVDKALRNMHYMMDSVLTHGFCMLCAKKKKKRYDLEKILELKETIILHASFRQIRCPYAQKRIMGMTEIMQHIEVVIEKNEYAKGGKVCAYSHYPTMMQTNKQKNKGQPTPDKEAIFKNVWANPKWMQQWIEENGVLNYILDRTTTHLELVRRILPMYQLFHYNGDIDNKKHLDPLWKLTTGGTHEVHSFVYLFSIQHIVYEHVAQISKNLSFSQLKHLFRQIKKHRTLKLIPNLQAQWQLQSPNSKKKQHWFGLDMLWDFVQSSDLAANPNGLLFILCYFHSFLTNEKTKIYTFYTTSSKTTVDRLIPEKVAKEGLTLFLTLLKTDYAISQLNRYTEKLKSSKIVQNLILLQKLTQTYPATKRTWLGTNSTQHPETQGGVIESLEKEYAIIDHVLQDLSLYKATVVSAVQAARRETQQKIEVQTFRVSNSYYGYLDQLKIRLDFLLYLLTHSSLRLTRQQYKIIWDHLITGALCREEMDLCYIWLLRGSIPPHYSAYIISDKLRLYDVDDQKYLFENCICKLPTADLSETGYLLVVSFFCAMNKRNGSLLLKGTKRRIPTPEERELIRQVTHGKVASLSQGLNLSKKELPASPTQSARETLGQYVVSMDSDLSNEDGSTYLIDPDDHFIDPTIVSVVDYQHLEGRNFLWEVVLKARLSNVGNQATELLNALHYTFPVIMKPKEQFDIRQAYVRRCLIYLMQGLAIDKSDEGRIIVKRMVRLLKSFLECFLDEDETKNTIEIEIKPHKFFRLASYKINIRRNDTFGTLRKMIFDRLFQIHNGLVESDMVIRWNTQIITSNYDTSRLTQLDWSKGTTLDILRNEHSLVRNFPKSIMNQPISQGYIHPIESSYPQPPQHPKLVGFKNIAVLRPFNKEQAAFDQLFPLLKNAKVAPVVWEILELLPPSFSRVQSVLNLVVQGTLDPKQFIQLFDFKDPYRMLYYLQILSAIVSGEEYREEYFTGRGISHMEWVTRFVQQGGFGVLCELLFNEEMTSTSMPTQNDKVDLLSDDAKSSDVGRKIRASCLAFCVQIISMLLSMEPLFQSIIPHNNKSLVQGSILNSDQWNSAKDRLVKKALQVSDVILQWADIPPDELKATNETTQVADNNNNNDNDDDDDDEIKPQIAGEPPIRPMRGSLLSPGRRGSADPSKRLNPIAETSEQVKNRTESAPKALKDIKPSARVSLRQVDLRVNRAVSVLKVNRHDMGPAGANILVECMFILVGCIRTSPAYVDTLFKTKDLQKWLTKLLFNHHYPDTREQMCKALQLLSRVSLSEFVSRQTYVGFLIMNNEKKSIGQSTDIDPTDKRVGKDCIEFFQLFLHVFDHVCRTHKQVDQSVALQLKADAEEFMKVLQNYVSTETYTDPERADAFLVGTLSLLRLCSTHQLFNNDQAVTTLIQYVYKDCLFNVPQHNYPGCKCKAVKSRQMGFALLHSLTTFYPNTLESLQALIYADPIWYHVRPRDLKEVSWKYHPTDEERFPVRFVGLKNQGSTCYMNSLLQQLFVNENFKRDILEARLTGIEEQKVEHEDEETKELKKHGICPKDSVLYQTQLLFGHLSISQKKYYDTLPFCMSFKGFDGKPMPLGEQQDVNEFCNRLFDQLEHDLNRTNRKDAIKDNFGGYLVNQMISKDEKCTHSSEREEKFLTVSLTVKNKANLEESLDLYVQGDLLDGENKYLCGQCNEKILALKRVCFKTLPKYLLLHLSRFEFDFNTMARVKLNSRLEYPMELNMKKYTAEGLVEKEQHEREEKEKENAEAEAEAEAETEKK